MSFQSICGFFCFHSPPHHTPPPPCCSCLFRYGPGAPHPTQGKKIKRASRPRPFPWQLDLLVSHCPPCVLRPLSSLTWLAKAPEPGLTLSTLPLPFSSSGRITESVLRGVWLLWLGSSRRNLRAAEKMVLVCSFVSLRIKSCFWMTEPRWQNKSKVFNVPGPQTLLPPSLFVSPYLCTLPSSSLPLHIPPTPPFGPPDLKRTMSFGCRLLRPSFTDLQSSATLHLKFYPDCTDTKPFSSMDVTQVTHSQACITQRWQLCSACSNVPWGWGVNLFFHTCCFDSLIRSHLVSVRSSSVKLRFLNYFFIIIITWLDWNDFWSYVGKYNDVIIQNFPKLWNFNIQQPLDRLWHGRTSWNHNCSSSQSMVRKFNGDPYCNVYSSSCGWHCNMCLYIHI